MTTYLYKVSAPRTDKIFYPSPFWHTPDWESSTTCYREGYIKDDVLFAGDFDEVNIHLFPRVRTVRVRSVDADISALYDLGVRCTPEKSAYVFVHHSWRKDVEAFTGGSADRRADGTRARCHRSARCVATRASRRTCRFAGGDELLSVLSSPATCSRSSSGRGRSGTPREVSNLNDR